jgi:alkylation response protein AidB-like acyl-CoA dehydrogenase
MDFNLSDEQAALQENLQGMLEKKFSTELMREAEQSTEGFPKAIWDESIALGLPKMTVPKELGGWGESLVDACVALEEVGRAGATVPLVTNSGLSSAILRNLPKGAHRDRSLADIASGKIFAPALIDEDARNEWDAVRLPLAAQGDGYTISGKKILVPFASSADELLISAITPEGKTAIIVVDADSQGIAITPHHSGAGVPVSTVELNEVVVPQARVIGVGGVALAALHDGLHVGALLATAEAIGLSETIKKLATEYAAQREAFGRPIGAFQAVAHPCADMHINNETIRLLVYQAAWMVDTGKDAVEEIASTKALANELFERVANDAFCFHGANGFAEEVDLQLFMRRIRHFCQTMGETHESLERAAQAAGV